MQIRFPSANLFLIAAILVFTSCGKTNKQGRYIPKTAAMAILFNGESLSSKMPWGEIKQNELFKNIYTDTTLDPYLKAALENPENTGIDIKKDLLFFIQKDSIGGYIVIQGTVKDAAKFKQFNSELTQVNAETEKNGIHFLSNEKMTASWDNEKFVVVIDAPQLTDINKFRRGPDSAAIMPTVIKRDLVSISTQTFNLKAENSLGKDEKFSELVDKKGDLHFWINITALNSDASGMPALSMINMSKLIEGSIVTGTASFENGKIVADVRSYSGKEMSEIWKKYEGTKISTEMIKRVSAKEVAVLFALNFKPEGIREFIKLAGLEGFANMGAGMLGFTLDDFIKANKGDIMFSVSDLKKDSMGSMKPDILFSASVGDKNSFGKLIEAGKKLGREKLGSDASPIVSYNTNEKYFAIGTRKESVDAFIDGKGNSNFDFLDKLSGSPAAMYINFQLLITGMGSSSSNRDSIDHVAYQATLNMWQNLMVTGGEFKDGAINQHVEVNLVDKTTNSLKQLNNYLGIMGTVQKQKKDTRNKMMSERVDIEEEIKRDTTNN